MDMRLDRYVSLCALGTRKKVKEYIYAGKVSWNGKVSTVPAQMIDSEKDVIAYEGERILPKVKYFVFHKPQGCVTAREEGVSTVFDYLSPEDREGIFAVGRLDRDTEGLLFLTNDGDFNHSIMFPTKDIEKRYYFLSMGTLTEEDKKMLNSTMDIGANSLTKPAKIEILEAGLLADLLPKIGKSKSRLTKKPPEGQRATIGILTITEGKKHQVKRMLRAVGCPVMYLKRLSVGQFSLPEDLMAGEYRSVTREELDVLFCREGS